MPDELFGIAGLQQTVCVEKLRLTRHTHPESVSKTGLFAAGQRFQTIHLAFIPELPGIPHVDATSLEGPSVEIMVGEVQRFGLRLELKLTQIYDEPVEVVIQVEVFAESSQAA